MAYGKAEFYFHESYSKAERLKYQVLREELMPGNAQGETVWLSRTEL